ARESDAEERERTRPSRWEWRPGREAGDTLLSVRQSRLPPLRAVVGTVLSTFLFTLAFLTKQQAALFLLGGALTLAWRRAWTLLVVFLLMAAILCGDVIWILNTVSEGWFGFYCFRLPLESGISWRLFPQFFGV